MDAQRRIEEIILAEHKLIAQRLSPQVIDHARRNLRCWAATDLDSDQRELLRGRIRRDFKQ